MRVPKFASIAAATMGLTMLVPAPLFAAPPGSRPASSLDSHPARIRYVSNDAPFVVFGVTPTQIDARAKTITLTFMATDPLAQVNVFPFVRAANDAPARMTRLVPCGPRDAGSWDCQIPTAELLAHLEGNDGEFGLRIEAHGEMRERANHSTVIITVPVRRAPAGVSG